MSVNLKMWFSVFVLSLVASCACGRAYAQCFDKKIKVDVATIAWVEYKNVVVLDGDTVNFQMVGIPAHLNPISLRIAHIDTPEISTVHGAKCQKEIDKGLLAKKTLTDMVAKAKSVKIRLLKWDCYGGRVDGDITVDGVDIGSYMIQQGLAKSYEGGVKSSWCN